MPEKNITNGTNVRMITLHYRLENAKVEKMLCKMQKHLLLP